ncbi:unnamed protein product [Cuscuta europaea]|uniref:CGL160/ATPI domain-containing protein n=1 Tax=Cuscuta europaea TaxID=41803 RepID=A0A9P0YRK1_CUSEU|nr:unnamed protein product [Cuscuta europaea]
MSYASAIFSQFLQPGLCTYSPSRRSFSSRIPGAVSVLKSYIPASGVDEDYVLRDFLKERKLNGDFIARISDKVWLRDIANVEYTESETGPTDNVQLLEEALGEGNEGGFLKFKSSRAWLLGETSPPVNKKRTIKLKRDLLFLTVSIGTACGGYCLLAFSPEAALSYTTGVFFSCIYLQLLCRHVDMLTREMVPDIFMKKKEKKIGIRSQDFKDLFERTVKGSGIALSSTRLVIPAAIYGLWELSQHSNHVLFDFQLVPAVLGLFVYKAAALVQVYRDNDDLQFVFPENEEVSGN